MVKSMTWKGAITGESRPRRSQTALKTAPISLVTDTDASYKVIYAPFHRYVSEGNQPSVCMYVRMYVHVTNLLHHLLPLSPPPLS